MLVFALLLLADAQSDARSAARSWTECVIASRWIGVAEQEPEAIAERALAACNGRRVEFERSAAAMHRQNGSSPNDALAQAALLSEDIAVELGAELIRAVLAYRRHAP